MFSQGLVFHVKHQPFFLRSLPTPLQRPPVPAIAGRSTLAGRPPGARPPLLAVRPAGADRAVRFTWNGGPVGAATPPG